MLDPEDPRQSGSRTALPATQPRLGKSAKYYASFSDRERPDIAADGPTDQSQGSSRHRSSREGRVVDDNVPTREWVKRAAGALIDVTGGPFAARDLVDKLSAIPGAGGSVEAALEKLIEEIEGYAPGALYPPRRAKGEPYGW